MVIPSVIYYDYSPLIYRALGSSTPCEVSMLHVTQLDRIVDVVEEASRGRVCTLLEKTLGSHVIWVNYNDLTTTSLEIIVRIWGTQPLCTPKPNGVGVSENVVYP